MRISRKWKVRISTAIVLAIGIAVLEHFREKAQQHSIRLACLNNMVEIGTAGRLWAEDHGGRFPTNFVCMSNELSTPYILRCPLDPDRRAATDFVNITVQNISYELLAPGLSITNTNTVVYRCPIHGLLGFADARIESQSRKLISYTITAAK